MSSSETENTVEQESTQLLPKERNFASSQPLINFQANQDFMEDQDKDQHNESQVSVMENTNYVNKEFISVWVRDPQQHKEDFWHMYVDYEICLHTNSMCFGKKTSCVRRRYSEFVWLRQKLQNNALLIELPKLPPWNPFFNLNNDFQVTQRMQGLQQFLEAVLQTPLLLSDSRLHLFLQSQLRIEKMDACARGQTHYTVGQAIQRCVCDARFPLEEQLREEDHKTGWDSDCDSTTSSGLGHSVGPASSVEEDSFHSESLAREFQVTIPETELFSNQSSSSNKQHVHSVI
ncbi:sorting nexin-10A-like isoform X1 [Xyrauchen texanus]|uniref:sorting nexin-10A-like isoform X1 n=2 Tax=Xyrauchen texanus TaxID=154827 RepID=UPI0022426142|nr:sorting nexin-10A-like isoform X1 [Xyrauchen texanus]XP_051949199.1 sorting nexin-10A-like isoform X1 [Xyrauchen texanus]